MSCLKFAVLGHPNEGKSSVVSTLTENERVRISETPGETTRCNAYVIEVEGEAALEIIDTPGFQNPSATLQWFEAWEGNEAEMVDAFILAHEKEASFHHDLELMIPLRDRAGILYVVDASRPLREADRQEMEVLRLIGLPRLALINFKTSDREFYPQWEEALKRRFNLIREFNAHRASFAERITLFDALSHLIPEQAEVLKEISKRMQEEWDLRIQESVLGVESLLIQCLRHQVKATYNEVKPLDPQKESAIQQYRKELQTFETKARKQWCKLYHHETLPSSEHSKDVIMEDLFAKKVWRLMGLSRRQLSIAGAMTAGTAGAAVDVAAGGITFGVFTAAGAVMGGLGGWMGAPKLGAKRWPFPGKKTLAREKILVGPTQDPQLMFILLDRALLYLTRLMNWAHGRRDHEAFLSEITGDAGPVREWSDSQRKAFLKWITLQSKPGHPDAAKASQALRKQLSGWLTTHSEKVDK